MTGRARATTARKATTEKDPAMTPCSSRLAAAPPRRWWVATVRMTVTRGTAPTNPAAPAPTRPATSVSAKVKAAATNMRTTTSSRPPPACSNSTPPASGHQRRAASRATADAAVAGTAGRANRPTTAATRPNTAKDASAARTGPVLRASSA